ncbi:phytoene desaturase [Ectothiorhodosinus mongolicus]|uniref:Phytoene dehydrogenase n=1 Tax=Ectothiorhodosinus mongolicus TaxID=233100 RepID=A0A1R3W5U4_9GAMM|nr:phytoene desaturase [Ectothiorhodosinus mongolicus]ULX57626.1 phytoene desaturase [Ectothiorhodosinus mongolicus]SIT73176.1 phytoene desaturase [Ectothiorhodosinus mongolicus]
MSAVLASDLPGTTSQDERPHAIVIGSGFGGLAAAIRLGSRGYRVTVLEKRDAPGGRAYVFHQDGFQFDAGPTIITAPFVLEELWQLCGKRMDDDIDLRAMDPFYQIRFHDGEIFNYWSGVDAVREEIRRFAPEDLDGYDAYMKASEANYRVGFEKLGHVAFNSVADMAKVVPELVMLRADRSVYALVSKYIKNERLRQVLSFHPLLVGGNPFRASSAYSLISYLERAFGVHSAMGGTGAIVRALVKLIEGQGSAVVCDAGVAQIMVKDGRACGVRLDNGEVIAADVVVSNADSATTYQKLLSETPRQRWTDAKVAKARYSMSLMVWYFGTKKRYEDIPHHMIILGPRYKALLKDIFDRKVLAEDFSLYLHRPTATDPSLAPPGCDTFYVLSPVPHQQSGIDWAQQAEPYRQRIEQHLSKHILPDLENQVISSRLITPQYFENELSSYQGAAFGMEPILTQSAWFRPHNQSEEVENLYLVGAGTHPGAGLPGVISSARVLDSVVPDPQVFRQGA